MFSYKLRARMKKFELIQTSRRWKTGSDVVFCVLTAVNVKEWNPEKQLKTYNKDCFSVDGFAL